MNARRNSRPRVTAAAVASIRRTARLVFRSRHDETRSDAETTPQSPETRDVEFVAYAEDCLLSGHLELAAQRLTDLLNHHEEYVLVDVFVERLAEASGVELKEVVVARDELFIVHATGPRGDPGRRHRTRQHPIAVQLGPYHVRGYLHALPGSDPIQALRRRKPMIPLTEAWVEYTAAGVRQRRHVSGLVFNRELMDWAVQATDEEVEYPEIPVVKDGGPMLKDFTGAVLTQPFAAGSDEAIA